MSGIKTGHTGPWLSVWRHGGNSSHEWRLIVAWGPEHDGAKGQAERVYERMRLELRQGSVRLVRHDECDEHDERGPGPNEIEDGLILRMYGAPLLRTRW